MALEFFSLLDEGIIFYYGEMSPVTLAFYHGVLLNLAWKKRINKKAFTVKHDFFFGARPAGLVAKISGPNC